LRHAKAAADGPDGDHSRPLTARGRRQAKALAQYIDGRRASGVRTPKTVLSSSAVRATQTAEIVMAGLDPDAELVIERGLYGADVDDVVTRLRLEDDPGPLLVVGHNPILHELALMLLGPTDTSGRYQLEQGLPTGALAIVSTGADAWPHLGLGEGRLLDMFVPPR
jgi:phosphohistidine phosphatase